MEERSLTRFPLHEMKSFILLLLLPISGCAVKEPVSALTASDDLKSPVDMPLRSASLEDPVILAIGDSESRIDAWLADSKMKVEEYLTGHRFIPVRKGVSGHERLIIADNAFIEITTIRTPEEPSWRIVKIRLCRPMMDYDLAQFEARAIAVTRLKKSDLTLR